MDSRCSGGSEVWPVNTSSDSYALPVDDECLDKDTSTFHRHHEGKVVRSKGTALCLARVSCALSVFTLLVVAVLCWFLVTRLTASLSLSSAGDTETCHPCGHPTSDPRSPLMDVVELRVDHNGTEMCCARTQAQHAALFRLITQFQAEKRHSTDMSTQHETTSQASHTPPHNAYAHLLFRPGLGPGERQQWKGPRDTHLSHVGAGLRFYDNALHVLTPGLYYVYCQFMFVIPEGSEQQYVSAYVFRESRVHPNWSGIVLKTRHTRLGKGTDFHVAHVGGLFYLQSSDRLHVKMSDTSLVSGDEKASFFGLFRVGD